MIKDHRNSEDYGGFEHYELNGQPLRIILDENLLQMDGDRLNAETGELERDVKVIQRVFRDDDCDDIDVDRFYELCAERIEEKSALAATGYVDES